MMNIDNMNIYNLELILIENNKRFLVNQMGKMQVI